MTPSPETPGELVIKLRVKQGDAEYSIRMSDAAILARNGQAAKPPEKAIQTTGLRTTGQFATDGPLAGYEVWAGSNNDLSITRVHVQRLLDLGKLATISPESEMQDEATFKPKVLIEQGPWEQDNLTVAVHANRGAQSACTLSTLQLSSKTNGSGDPGQGQGTKKDDLLLH